MPNQQVMRCLSPDCHRLFKIAQFSFLDTSWERGKIVCPHCSASAVGPSDFVYLSYALTEREEERANQDGMGPPLETGGDAGPS